MATPPAPRRPAAALAELEQLRFVFRRGAARRKLALLDVLDRGSLDGADLVALLHELLCFMRAYPDSRTVLESVESMLETFATRDDLVRNRRELVNSGIAGTDIEFPFFWFTVEWLVRRWPDRLRLDWAAMTHRQRNLLDRRLAMLMPYCETLALEEAVMSTREWVDYLKGDNESDAAFVVRRFRALRADPLPRESVYEELNLPFRLKYGPDTPTTTRIRYGRSPVVFQGIRPLVGTREGFREKIERTPIGVSSVSRREAGKLIDLARELMVVRERDLDAFVHGDERDVRLLEAPEGLQFVCIGTRPERRQMLDAAYGFLMLRNGVPIGYVLSASLFGSSEVAFNVSPGFRGAEAAHLYARTLAAVRRLFVADTIMVDPYQMGHDNPEGLRSGAWWFYYKLGFRPREPAIARMAEAEERKTRSDRRYRSSLAKLNRLSSVNMYLDLAEPRDEIIGEFARENVGLHIVRYLADRFGSDRERGLRRCSREAADLLEMESRRDLTPGERLAWERWAPLVRLIPGVESWPKSARVALARVVRAKGGRRESDFVKLFDRHRRLRKAIWELSAEPPGPLG